MLRDIREKEASLEEDNSWVDYSVSKTKSRKMSSSEMVAEVLQLAMPSWPLQNIVAVNPFWNYKHKSFEKTVQDLEKPLGVKLLLDLDQYLVKYDKREISDDKLERALSRSSLAQKSPYYFIRKAHRYKDQASKSVLKSFAELSLSSKDHELLVADMCKHLMAFFDRRQALINSNKTKDSFWDYWLETQRHDHSMSFLGYKNFKKLVSSLKEKKTTEVLDLILNRLGFQEQKAKISYMQVVLSRVLGWLSHFSYYSWQKNLGYNVSEHGNGEDLLVVSLVYDFASFDKNQKMLPKFQDMYSQGQSHDEIWKQEARSVLQKAWESTEQSKIIGLINKEKPLDSKPWCQMVFCIDVRSEMIRRAIEDRQSGVSTKGFAGFFGLALDLKKKSYRDNTNHLPVLLSPQFKGSLQENPKNTDIQVAESFIKQVRKLSFSSFFYVEVFGILTAWKLLRDSLGGFFKKTELSEVIDKDLMTESVQVKSQDFKNISSKDLAEKCAGVLGHMGLTKDFPKLVVFVGHTSHTTNNAFGSSLACGACGGHGGELNAKILADLLNKREIRKELQTHGITIPAETSFVAGVHETVTDKVMLFPYQNVSAEMNQRLNQLQIDLDESTKKATLERRYARSFAKLTSEERVKSFNWAEVRPEWGLAGNHSFIVAPRFRTKGQNLSSRSFLHDYNWKEDKGFQTLELIMTAPMVVTNWINMQYYSSVVAPERFSAGSKTLHNIVGETGVLQGNGGDLQIGLPQESFHDGQKSVHDPLRLSVYIEAPEKAIEMIITKHDVVRNLVNNSWLILHRICSKSGKVFERSIKNNKEVQWEECT